MAIISLCFFFIFVKGVFLICDTATSIKTGFRFKIGECYAVDKLDFQDDIKPLQDDLTPLQVDNKLLQDDFFK